MFEFVFDILPAVVQVVSSALEVFQPLAEATNIATGALLETATGAASELHEAAGALIESGAAPTTEGAAVANPAIQ